MYLTGNKAEAIPCVIVILIDVREDDPEIFKQCLFNLLATFT